MPPLEQCRVDAVVRRLVRIIGRRTARDDLAVRTTVAANDNAPQIGDETDGDART